MSARTDKERLDWLEARANVEGWLGVLIARETNGYAVGQTFGAGFNGWCDGDGPSVRLAIDAALDADDQRADP